MKQSLFMIIALVIMFAIVMTFLVFMDSIGPKTFQVSIKDSKITPGFFTIKNGDTVVWTNYDSSVCTITPAENDNLVDNNLSTGQTFTHTFHTSDTYRYHCDHDPKISGTILVK